MTNEVESSSADKARLTDGSRSSTPWRAAASKASLWHMEAHTRPNSRKYLDNNKFRKTRVWTSGAESLALLGASTRPLGPLGLFVGAAAFFPQH